MGVCKKKYNYGYYTGTQCSDPSDPGCGPNEIWWDLLFLFKSVKVEKEEVRKEIVYCM